MVFGPAVTTTMVRRPAMASVSAPTGVHVTFPIVAEWNAWCVAGREAWRLHPGARVCYEDPTSIDTCGRSRISRFNAGLTLGNIWC